MNKKVSIFAGNGCSKEKEAHYFAIAHRMGELLAKNNFVTVTGAGAGLMDEALRGAFEAGGHTIGIALNFEGRKPSQYLTDSTVFEKLGPRQDKLIELADAYVALPGGVGTFYEIFNILALKRLKEIPAEKPLILVCDYYKGLQKMLRAMADEGFVEEKVFSLFSLVETPEEALASLTK